MAEQSLSERTWIKVGAWTLLTGVVSLAVSTATVAWKTRDFVDARDERLLQAIRANELAHYVSKDDFNEKRYQDAERLNAKLELILDKIRSQR